MGNAISSYETIHNNPFILAPLFPAFYSSYSSRENDLLLSYLVLPLVLYPKSRGFLSRANIRSSVRTLIEDRERIFGISESVASYKSLTSSSMQYAIEFGALEISENLSVLVGDKALDKALCPTETIKASVRLGKLFDPFDIPTIYRMLGIKKL